MNGMSLVVTAEVEGAAAHPDPAGLTEQERRHLGLDAEERQ